MTGTKKGIIICLCIAVLSVTFLGCAEAPPEVKAEIEKMEAAKREQQELIKNITFVSPSELSRAARADFSLDHGLFQFQGDVIVPACEKVYLLKVKVNDGALLNADQKIPLVMKYLGMEESDWKQYVTGENDGKWSSYRADEVFESHEDAMGWCNLEMNNTDIFINEAGRIAIMEKVEEKEHPHFMMGGRVVKSYFFINDKDTALDTEIDLNGQKITLSQLNEDFEKSMQLMNDWSPELHLVLHDARIVEEIETGNTMVVLRALSSYEGVCIDSNCIYPQESKLTGGLSFVGLEMRQQLHYPGDRCEVRLCESSYVVSGENREYDKVIDFDSALYLLEHTVPQDKITMIESAEFVYQIFYEGEDGMYWMQTSENPPVFFARPVWKFVEKDRPSEWRATVYYVDAVSGEVYSFYKSCTP